MRPLSCWRENYPCRIFGPNLTRHGSLPTCVTHQKNLPRTGHMDRIVNFSGTLASPSDTLTTILSATGVTVQIHHESAERLTSLSLSVPPFPFQIHLVFCKH